MRLFDAINSYKPVLAGVCLFEIRQIKVFVADDCVSSTVISGWSSANKVKEKKNNKLE